ncbi:DMT family transporter [Sporolactobacillus laevolacticus]|uniref:Membrane protein n=1 Tax=Sporolactobacillus laevolacticus DSM 442 TaxID=1395513 RepID=V6IUR2_9BACL|nr:DMT family transporter [Sporolactobacillus laevolacticus]EST10750.1 membrane protein [Sporolactobacillus laevolacticus DSM 442]
MISLLLIAGFFSGMTIPIQTSINSRLGLQVKSPYIASAISFLVGTLVLLIVSFLAEPHFASDIGLLSSIPWWILIGGGCLGVFYLTSNILLLPRLGSALTVVVTLLGQMIMAISIDQFGWFHVPIHELNGPRMIGILLMFVGVYVIKKY